MPFPKRTSGAKMKTEATAESADSDVENFSNLFEVAIRQKNEGSRSLYDKLTSRLLSTDISDEEFSDMILGYKVCSSLLDKQHESVANAFLGMDLSGKSNEILLQFHDAVVDIVTHQPYTMPTCVKMFVSSFRTPCSEDNEGKDLSVLAQHRLSVLREVLKLVPMSVTTIFQQCKVQFPYTNKPEEILSHYVRCLLEIMLFAPEISQNLLDLIVDNMVKIDVSFSRENLSVKLEELFQEQDTQFDIEMSTEKKQDSSDKVIEAANKLDALMSILCEFIIKFCYEEGKENLNIKKTRAFFNKMEKTFNTLIVSTCNCSHIQFLMFFISSFHLSICERFLQVCWNNIQDPTVPVILSQISCAYIGGMLTRARYIPLNAVKRWLQILVEFIHKYINSQDSDVAVLPTKHKVFYRLCQTVFYVVVFHQADISANSDGVNFLRKLNFERIVMSRLNPLRFCLPSVTDLFARVCRHHQIAFCYTVIERNNRVFVKEDSSLIETVNRETQLQHYFPFDPYLLKKSSAFIAPHYREWDGFHVASEVKENVEEEDFLMNEVVKSLENSLDIMRKHSILDMDIAISPGFGTSFY